MVEIEKVYVHGALMVVAWVFLVPCAVIVARHKWLFPPDCKVRGVGVWFRLHQAFNLSGFILLVISFAWASALFEGSKITSSEGTAAGQAHDIIGTIVMGLAAVQVVLGFVRPSPDAGRRRSRWNMAHHYLGRLTLLAAWTAIYLGIHLAHTAYGFSYTQWIIPVAVIMGLMVLLDIGLSLEKGLFGAGKASGSAAAQGSANHVVTVAPGTNAEGLAPGVK